MKLIINEYNEELIPRTNDLFSNHLYLAERISSFFALKFNSLNITKDDLYQVALIGLSDASKVYKNDSAATFSTFATTVIKRSIYKYLRKFQSMKVIINEESLVYQDDKFSKSYNPEDIVITKEINEFILNYKHSLDLLDASIFELRVNGFSNKEIARLLDIEYGKVARIYCKCRNKLIELLKCI